MQSVFVGILCFALVFASDHDHCEHAEELTEDGTPWSMEFNNGFARVQDNLIPESLHLLILFNSAEMTELCQDRTATVQKLYQRQDMFQAQVSCDDAVTKWVTFTAVISIELEMSVDSVTDYAIVEMRESYEPISEIQASQFLYLMAPALDDNCELVMSDCIIDPSTGTNMVCTYMCYDDEEHTSARLGYAYVVITLPTAVLDISCVRDTAFSDVSKMCLGKAAGLIEDSANTMVFLRNHCNMTGEIKIADSMYMDIEGQGTQYLIEVYSEDAPSTKRAFCAIYDYSFAPADTTPFIVAVPFMELEHGKMFVKAIKSFGQM